MYLLFWRFCNYGECIYGLVFHHTFRGHVTHDRRVVWKYFFYKKLQNQICVTYQKIFGCTPRLCTWKKIQKSPMHAPLNSFLFIWTYFFSLWENLMYIHFYRIKGRLRYPRKCTGKQMHIFVAGFHCVSVHEISGYLHKFTMYIDILKIFHY